MLTRLRNKVVLFYLFNSVYPHATEFGELLTFCAGSANTPLLYRDTHMLTVKALASHWWLGTESDKCGGPWVEWARPLLRVSTLIRPV